MMTSNYIIDISEDNFEHEVLNYSYHSPVVVDFWAQWCVPCRVLEPMLQKMAIESAGRFRLARVNVDENPKLAERMKVNNLPAIKAFVDGRIISEFTGVLPESNLRDYLSHLSLAEGHLLLEKGRSQLMDHLWQDAEETFRTYLEQSPVQPTALLGLAKSLLMQAKAHEALMILDDFPASQEYASAMLLKPLINEYLWLQTQNTSLDSPLDAAYQNGLRLSMKGNILPALDGFLDILRKNKHYRDGIVKDVFLGLLSLLGEADPDVRQYRSELSNVLF